MQNQQGNFDQNDPNSRFAQLPSQSRDQNYLSQTEAFFLAVQHFRQPLARVSPSKHPRKYRRELRSISVSIQPLDEDFQPCGEMFWVVSRDISLKGIGIISNEAIPRGYVRIGLIDDSITTIGEVRHNTSIGHRYPLYLVGIEFLKELHIDDDI